MNVKASKYQPARTDGVCEWYTHRYAAHTGLTRVERKTLETDSDFIHNAQERISPDNGLTWGPWVDITSETLLYMGSHEIETTSFTKIWNPIHSHFVEMLLERVFTNGHKEAYDRWYKAEAAFSDHTLLRISTESGESSTQLVHYESGLEHRPIDPTTPEYYNRNMAYCGTNLVVDPQGDLLIPLGVPVSKCCELLGSNVEDVFPSCPQIMKGIILVRGVWNGSQYDFIPSQPVVISDRLSSRGVDEPTVALLNQGRILIVFRGSNVRNPHWNTRIEPGMPSTKWYTYSDDQGRTFSPPSPWHFDDGEIIYSSATISYFVRNSQSGNLYWIGNITDHKAYSNYPRWPLCLVRVNEEFGVAEKDSLTIIDTKREGESDLVQLSNFSFLENRETGRLELYVTKIGQYDNQPWQHGDVWHYEIDWT